MTNRRHEERSWIQKLPLVVGILGGSLLLINRLFFTPDLLNSQSRSDALGILVSALLVLTGLLWQQIQPPDPTAVSLEGEPQCQFHPDLSETQQLELGWASHALLSLTAARSLVIYWNHQVLLWRGIFPKGELRYQSGSIVQRVLETERAIYLVDLKLFPAREEFTHYFPINIQTIVCQPIGTQGVLILASDTPRSFSKRDQAWIEALAQKLDQELT